MTKLETLFDALWPITRSITGNGVRESLDIIDTNHLLTRYEIPTGTHVLDWVVPKEWNPRAAWIKGPNQEKILDFNNNNLHLLGYSCSVHKQVSLEELKSHLYVSEVVPHAIPYRTSYYEQRWGFCMSKDQYDLLDEGTYEVFIDASLTDGHMTIADYVKPGLLKDEVLFTSYLCHPSMANNELSGPLVLSQLMEHIHSLGETKYTYRFVIAPETIGAITYLDSQGKDLIEHVKAGFVLTCQGTSVPYTYKRSKRGDGLGDQVVENLLAQEEGSRIVDFYPFGSDERQYCSPGFNLPVGSLMRSVYLEYDAYHTSADNKDLISFDAMEEGIEFYKNVIFVLETNCKFVNLKPHGEPHLKKYALMDGLGARSDKGLLHKAIMYLLSYGEGSLSLLDLSNLSGLSYKVVYEAFALLRQKSLIKGI